MCDSVCGECVYTHSHLSAICVSILNHIGNAPSVVLLSVEYLVCVSHSEEMCSRDSALAATQFERKKRERARERDRRRER